MKKILFILVNIISFLGFAQQVTISPAQFNVTDQITITANFSSATCNTMGAAPAKVYMHSGIGNDTNAFGYAVIGNWATDNGVGQMTLVSPGVYSKTITPSVYYGISASQQLTATKIGMVFRNALGSQTLKLAPGCNDFIFNVGLFQTNLTAPIANSSTIISSGGSLNIAANNTNGVANYNLLANGVSINSATSTSNYTFPVTNITTNQNYQLVITQGSNTSTINFSVIVNPGIIAGGLPSGLLEGINYNPTDNTKATLVLDALGKDFVYVAGTFNNWQPNASYAMKKDFSSSKFFLELTGLTPGLDYSYQYWVADVTPIAGSPVLVKTADPYSTLVLSPFDDPYISATTYPNLPAYPIGQSREVTVLKTGQTPYVWQNTTFNKPKKDDLIVYEVLVRDFDSNKNYQDLINKIDYFKNLKVNAIELMPIMEFDGNESWGYNTSFHLALDKAYGTADKFKEFVDLCHTNGIAVILDVALNHAFGRNPFNRMWMNDPDGDGWGGVATDSPYFNVNATHSYSVGNDFNHQQQRTKTYVKRVVKQWIEEFHIDGFRWDLTKGFTQNAAGSDALTNGYQQDRVDVLKEYTDYAWTLDPTHYTIFEHLGSENEEKEWANYRINETPSKGVMMWGEMTYAYSQILGGYASGGSIAGIGAKSRTTFTGKRVIGYPESHDKERIMYSATTFGVTTGTSPVRNNLNNALGRMSAIGASSILVPGPKMLWHFADLGMEKSIYVCSNGTFNDESNTLPGDCKLDTKPQPQWTNNWLAIAERAKIYSDWSKMIALKINEPVFEGDYSISPENGDNLKQRIYVFDNSLPVTQLKNVVVLCNFTTNSININPSFPYTGTWYNLIDNTTMGVSDVNATLTIPAGQFLVYGNLPATLTSESFNFNKSISIYPNPTSSSFKLNGFVTKTEIYSTTGQIIKKFDGNFDSEYSFDINDLSNGIYLVKVTDENNNNKSFKLVKQ
jgi:Alpha amylase, catalytic domain/Secretion system C-terminal sorting domain